ncbi:hypothetical protein RF11_16481 [Thelohanellus kitauei]|uniref:Uncharacterized protein n=1 Tax=Thelohanellus kitauei TaxID=669202 RepID=A0A0C2NEL0_THEKT|nr:hypothetical protein RF11_16481 [Thelohanellus kitauei]
MKMFKWKSKNMTALVVSLNNSEYHAGEIRHHYNHIYSRYPNYFIKYYCDYHKSQMDSNDLSNPLDRASFPDLAKLILLLYELKYMYGDIHSQFHTIQFYPDLQP